MGKGLETLVIVPTVSFAWVLGPSVFGEVDWMVGTMPLGGTDV